jgi:lactosylceramide 4-alpha-galactosyltransferase
MFPNCFVRKLSRWTVSIAIPKYRRHTVPVYFQVTELATRSCKGFQILASKEFFPIPYQDWQLFFYEIGSEETMRKIQGSFGVHVWNKLSKQTAVTVGSKQPYSLMAETACPRVYSACGREF